MSSDCHSSVPTLATVQSMAKNELTSPSVSSTPTRQQITNSHDSGGEKHRSLVYSDPHFSITLHHYDSIVGELKCPGCAQPMYGAIVVCRTGHSICSHCSNRVSLCPLCRKKLTDMRNYTLEAIAAKVQFPCTHAARGCTVRLPLQLLWWHKDRCGYKQIECFMGKVWENCSWHGCEKDWIVHCMKKHQDKVYNSPDVLLTWNYGADCERCIEIQSVIAYYVIQGFDEYFNVYHIYDQSSRRTIWTVICATRENKISHRFAFELELYSPVDSSKLLVQRFPCHSENDADFLKDGNCAKIMLSEAIRFMTQDKILYYRIRIVEVTPSRSQSMVLIGSGQKSQSSLSEQMLPVDYTATKYEHVNMKAVPERDIIVRNSRGSLNNIESDRISAHSYDSSSLSTILDEEQTELPEAEQFRGKRTSTPVDARVNSHPKPPRVNAQDTQAEINNCIGGSDQQLLRCRIVEREESVKMRPVYSDEGWDTRKDSSKRSSESLSVPPTGLSKFYNITSYRASKLFNVKGLAPKLMFE